MYQKSPSFFILSSLGFICLLFLGFQSFTFANYLTNDSSNAIEETEAGIPSKERIKQYLETASQKFIECCGPNGSRHQVKLHSYDVQERTESVIIRGEMTWIGGRGSNIWLEFKIQCGYDGSGPNWRVTDNGGGFLYPGCRACDLGGSIRY